MTVKEKLVTIRHPELDVESQVMEESVPVWVEQGWEVVGRTFPEMTEDVAGEELQDVFDFSEDDDPSEASEKE
jgi:hypothetical protein